MLNNEIIEMSQKYLLNTYKRYPIAFDKGKGARVFDKEGKGYIDFLAGIAVSSLGYNNEKLVEAISKQAALIMHSSNYYYIEPQAKLAKLLCDNSFADKAFFCNSGTEANEAAIKLARKYGTSKYGSSRYKIISMQNSFHGRTMGSLSATAQEKYQNSFKPMLEGFVYAKYNDFDDLIQKIDDDVCAVIIEPIQGEGGVLPLDIDYVKRVREYLNKKDILLIFDEVQCGIGRTGYIFAHEKYGVYPDVMTLAKGLAGGVPIGAMLVCEKLNSVLLPGDHGTTFGGNHLACTCGVVVMEELKEWVIENVKKSSKALFDRLNQIKEKTGGIEYITGFGLMIGVKLNEKIDSAELAKNCLEKGLIINSQANNMLRIVPPLVITLEDINDGCSVLETEILYLLG